MTASGTKEVEEFARKIKRYVIEDNKEGFGELINYPINVHINGTKVKLNNAEEYEQNYEGIINKDFKESISNSYTKYMNYSHNGIMLGYGDVWFESWEGDIGLRIIAINN